MSTKFGIKMWKVEHDKNFVSLIWRDDINSHADFEETGVYMVESNHNFIS